MKLLLLIDTLDDIQGGAERQVFDFIRCINKKTFEVYLFLLHQTDIPVDIQRIGITAVGLGIKRIYDMKGLRQGIFFQNYLRENQIDILITYHFASDIWGTIWAKLAGTPVIISNRRDAGFWRNRHHILAYRLVNRWVNRILGNSEAVRQMVLRQEGVDAKKVRIFYNGVDLKRFDPENIPSLQKNDLGLPEQSKIILCVGNLRPIKGHQFLIEAAPKVIEQYPQVYFIFAGDGELADTLKERAKDLSIGQHVMFLGKRDDVPALLSLADLCVLPSLSEGFSNTILEYMAAAKPVIATRVGGNSDIIEHGRNGLLVESKNSQALCKQIIYLLDHPLKAQQLALEAKQDILKYFSLKRQIDDMEKFLIEEYNNVKTNSYSASY